MTIEASQEKSSLAASGECPVKHKTFSSQKTSRQLAISPKRVEQLAPDTWIIRGYEEARAVLRSNDTRQAGFKAELIEKLPRTIRLPILFQNGKPHLEQRKKLARFFAPKTVDSTYRGLMEKWADNLVVELRRKGKVDLSDFSLRLAVRVAAEVVGLTNSVVPGMTGRLNAFFNTNQSQLSWKNPTSIFNFLKTQLYVGQFFLLDVKPAIQARRKKPQEDVITYLISEGYNDLEIVTECIMYGAAGMVTTREFISVAAWHLLEQPELRAQYLAASEDERYEILHEILRVEPVVGHLLRRTTEEVTIQSEGKPITFPKGALLDLHIYATNADELITGEQPQAVCPHRELSSSNISLPLLSFGDGVHRCPGAYIAVQESDIFLTRLLSLSNLQIEQKPAVSWDDSISTYEVRKFMLTLAK